MSRSSRVIVAAIAAIAAISGSPAVAGAGTFPVAICGTSARDAGDGLSWSSQAPLSAGPTCPAGGLGLSIYAQPHQTAARNATGAFKVTAPPGITIYSIHVANASSGGLGDDKYGAAGWWGEFYWGGGPGPAGRSGPLNDTGFRAGGCCSQTNLQSQTIGWFLACNQSSCSTGSSGVGITVGELDLTAEEFQAPTILAEGGNNLWYHDGWVRGSWPVSFTASDPSGVCGAAVVFGTLPAIVTPTPDTAPDRHTWQQCPQQSVPAWVDTNASDGSLGHGEGAMQLRFTATNTASVTANPTKTVYVDNSTPTVSISGPTDAPSTAGVQYMTATAGGSPSGIADIVCTVDGGPPQSYPGATARVPVSGIGVHSVNCYAEDNAVDASGTHGTSAPASRSMKIGRPTMVGLAFDKFLRLRCHRTRARVTIPGHWITVRRHGKRVRIRSRSRTKLERVVRCHPRRVIGSAARLVAFGRRTTVSGYLETTTGIALGGRQVRVMTAPDNGNGQFSQAAVATTTPTGAWSARLPAGPSRIVEAVYDGDPTTEGAFSREVKVLVPAKVRLLSVSPNRVPWGGTVRITARLLGGYLPPGGALVRLRIGQGPSYQTYGVQTHVTGRGKFTTTYTFGAGYAGIVKRFWFQVATLPIGNYPYAPGASGRRFVSVGGNPPRK
jgi:hypothetical protein